MCLVALALDCHPRFPLLIAANRDEFHDRPALPLQWWSPGDDAAPILGGRDLRAGGTWLGLTRAGRLALLTNVREPGRHDPAAPSRGDIVLQWLRGDEPAAAFHRRIAARGHNGYNLIAADFAAGACFWASNRAAALQPLGRGVWGLSNGGLDTPWPKVLRLKARVAAALDAARDADSLADALFAALADRAPAADAELPSTGVPADWERALSAAFIERPEHGYGTRCSTLLIAERQADGGLSTHAIERAFDRDGAAGATRCETLADWPPAPAQSARTISTCGMPASSNIGPRSTKPARA